MRGDKSATVHGRIVVRTKTATLANGEAAFYYKCPIPGCPGRANHRSSWAEPKETASHTCLIAPGVVAAHEATLKARQQLADGWQGANFR